MDLKALKQAILRELQRQGCGSAEIKFFAYMGEPLEVEIRYCPGPSDFYQPISDQLEGLDPANVRELDPEIAEFIGAGLLERKDGGYALTDHHQ